MCNTYVDDFFANLGKGYETEADPLDVAISAIVNMDEDEMQTFFAKLNDIVGIVSFAMGGVLKNRKLDAYDEPDDVKFEDFCISVFVEKSNIEPLIALYERIDSQMNFQARRMDGLAAQVQISAMSPTFFGFAISYKQENDDTQVAGDAYPHDPDTDMETDL